MADQLVQVDTRKIPVRVLMLFALLLALLWSWFVVRWYIGNTMAEYLDPDENTMQTVRFAASLAPNDPLAHWRLGQAMQKKLPADQMDQAIREYETAVSLAPNDYRFWMSLGIALEQKGNEEAAEKALRRSVQLAPSYSYPAWYLGNLLLREMRYGEGFVELQRASEGDPELRPQLFNLAWEVYSTQLEGLKSAIGPMAETRAQFAQYLLERNRFSDGIRLWNSLNENEKKSNRETGKTIIATLLTAKHFQNAMAVWNDLSPSLTYRAAVGKILDGGFENELPRGGSEAAFDWQVKTAPQMQIGIDPNNGHNSDRSLRLTFQVRSRIEGINVSQLVAVVPSSEYDLECFVKTLDLESVATPLIEILDATDGLVLTKSEAAPAGTQEWQRLSVTFKTGAKSEAIIVRMSRSSCGENVVCPIFGSVWYDDFNLTRRG